jgi:chromosome segregation ATPase
LSFGLTSILLSAGNSEALDSQVLPQAAPDSILYNTEIEQKLTARCPVIKDYLAQTVRINELAARQNKVRGWEYLLRSLDSLKNSYNNLGANYDELSKNTQSLRQQLEQFKVDFEAYDGQFQRLLSVDCKANPQQFWNELNTLRSFRSGVALSSENYKLNLSGVISKEESKW